MAASGYSVYFLLELKRVDGGFEEENEILQKDIDENSNNIV